MINNKWLLLLTFFLSNSPLGHDLHISVCDIQIDDEGIEIVIKTFIDDLQDAMGLEPGDQLPSEYSSSDEMIENYLVANFKISINDKVMHLVLDDISASMQAVWITFKINDSLPARFDKIEVESVLLTEVYKDQTNLINVKYRGKRKSYILNRKKISAVYQIE